MALELSTKVFSVKNGSHTCGTKVFSTEFSFLEISLCMVWLLSYILCVTTYRYYIGQQAYILITDLDILKQIMVKDFDNFCDHNVSNTNLHDRYEYYSSS